MKKKFKEKHDEVIIFNYLVNSLQSSDIIRQVVQTFDNLFETVERTVDTEDLKLALNFNIYTSGIYIAFDEIIPYNHITFGLSCNRSQFVCLQLITTEKRSDP